jgi:hypothetical protein
VNAFTYTFLATKTLMLASFYTMQSEFWSKIIGNTKFTISKIDYQFNRVVPKVGSNKPQRLIFASVSEVSCSCAFIFLDMHTIAMQQQVFCALEFILAKTHFPVIKK